MNLIFQILMLGCLYAALKVVGQIVSQRRCIADNEIRKFYLGQLPDHKKRTIVGHLGICEKCQERLHSFSFGSDIKEHLIEDE